MAKTETLFQIRTKTSVHILTLFADKGGRTLSKINPSRQEYLNYLLQKQVGVTSVESITNNSPNLVTCNSNDAVGIRQSEPTNLQSCEK